MMRSSSPVPWSGRVVLLLCLLLTFGCRPSEDSSRGAPTEASSRSPGGPAQAEVAPEKVSYPALPQPLRGDWMKSQAEEEAERLAEAFPDDLDALDLKATVHQLSGRNDEAFEIWRKCLELRPDFLRAYVPMIRIARRKGDYAEAERLCRACLRLDPLQGEARGLLAAVLFERGEYDTAIETVLAGQALGAINAEAIFFQGQAYQKKQEHEKAVAAFRDAIRLEPNYTRAYYALSVSLARLGRKDEAAEARNRFRDLQRGDMAANAAILEVESEEFVRKTVAAVFLRAGVVWVDRGRNQDAERCWLFAAVLVPKDSASRLRLATLYLSQGRLGLVQTLLNEVGAGELRDANLLRARGLLLLRTARCAEAARDFQAWIELAPRAAEAYALLAQAYLTMGGKKAEALKAAEAAARMAPTSDNLLVLAIAHAEAGDQEAALQISQRLLRQTPQSPEVHRLYEMLRSGHH